MRSRALALLTLGVGLAVTMVAAVPVAAHHSFAAEFDAAQPITIRGKVTKISWTNPHVWVYLNVADEKTGKVENWGFEMGAPQQVRARGWDRDTLVPGIATSLGQVSANGLVWTYHLKPGLKFEDGTPVTSADVKYAVERTYDRAVLANGPTYFPVLLIARDFTEHMLASEALRQTQSDLAHVNRVSTMGELTASLAHEVNQPIAAAITDANTCLRWLTRDPPDMDEAREAASRALKDATRAAEIISRVRLLFKKGTPQRELVDVNEVIREMIVLLRSETTRYSVSVFSDLAADLPQVMGDRVQLQQVLMNLMINGVDAMKGLDAKRELTIRSKRIKNEELMVSVSDTGVGLPPQQADQIFNAFFTTKSHGTGMGLSISRSIVESHGGRLWATDNPPRGASFHLTLSTKAETHE